MRSWLNGSMVVWLYVDPRSIEPQGLAGMMLARMAALGQQYSIAAPSTT